jgi:hypothetical protein
MDAFEKCICSRGTFTELHCDCTGIQYCRCRGVVKLFRFLLSPYSLLRTYNSVQNCIFNPELLGFWALPIVRYSKNTREHNISETGSVAILR